MRGIVGRMLCKYKSEPALMTDLGYKQAPLGLPLWKAKRGF